MKMFCFILGFLVFTSTAYPKKSEIKSTQNNDKVSSKQEEKSKLATSIDFSEQTNLELLKRASNKNNPDAQYELASRYFKGKGLPVNHEKALNLLEKSAEQNNYKAQLLLANFYNTGLCSLNVDTNKAIYYYELASKHENKAYPIYSMATIYEQGDKNKREIAVDLYIQAANLGCKNSLYRIENIAKNSIKAQFHLALLHKNIDTNKAVDKFTPFLENTKYKNQAAKELKEIADMGNPKALSPFSTRH